MQSYKWAPLALLVLAVAAAPASAQAPGSKLAGDEYFNVTSQTVSTVDPVGAVLAAPRIQCLGGSETGDLVTPCSEGSRVRLSHMKTMSKLFLDLDSVTANAWALLDTSANWNARYTGPVWGTVRIEICDTPAPVLADGAWILCPQSLGTFEGTWSGVRTLYGTGFQTAIVIEAFGLAGDWENTELHLKEHLYSATPMPLAYRGYMSGQINWPRD